LTLKLTGVAWYWACKLLLHHLTCWQYSTDLTTVTHFLKENKLLTCHMVLVLSMGCLFFRFFICNSAYLSQLLNHLTYVASPPSSWFERFAAGFTKLFVYRRKTTTSSPERKHLSMRVWSYRQAFICHAEWLMGYQQNCLLTEATVIRSSILAWTWQVKSSMLYQSSFLSDMFSVHNQCDDIDSIKNIVLLLFLGTAEHSSDKRYRENNILFMFLWNGDALCHKTHLLLTTFSPAV
jgi:hypothetical protein